MADYYFYKKLLYSRKVAQWHSGTAGVVHFSTLPLKDKFSNSNFEITFAPFTQNRKLKFLLHYNSITNEITVY